MWREIPGAVAEVTESNGVNLKWQRLCFNMHASLEVLNIPVGTHWWMHAPFYGRFTMYGEDSA